MVKLTKKFELDNCKSKSSYSIFHKDIPIELGPELIDAIKYLLWYVPNIASVQSKDNELISNMLYDDFSFLEIMRFMNLRDEDVLFTNVISKEIEDFYTDKICTNSQKIVMTKSDDETKTSSLLRHIRNAIAHGYFNIVDGLLVGFDYKYTQNNRQECKAFFKIKPENLLAALKNLNSELTNEKLVKRALETCGYEVKHYINENSNFKFDISARKKNRKYAMEIFPYKQVDFIHSKDIDEIINKFHGLFNDIRPVVVINTSFLTEDAKEMLLDYSVIILDVKNIKKMLRGRDMLYEIERDNRINPVKEV